MEIKENISLAPYTTLGVGGPARWFVEAIGEEEIRDAVEWADRRGSRIFVLGGGSNLLVADAGFPDLVVHIANRGVREEQDGNDTLFTVAAGEDWDGFVASVVDRDFAGVECLSGIPGTVGGTPVQNVGAYGQEVSSTIVGVRALDRQTLRFAQFSNAECEFAYRRSLFNTTAANRMIVTEVTYRLRAHGAPLTAYKDLAEYFAQNHRQPTLKEVRERVRAVRHSKGMLIVAGDPDCRSAGSFFKNPVVTETRFAEIASRAPESAAPPRFPSGDGRVKIPAAWLIEQAGFAKGFTLGQAAISSRHTLALVNRGGATATEMLALRDRIRERVLDQFGISLEQEPVYLSGC